jgi:hypothetical protein
VPEIRVDCVDRVQPCLVSARSIAYRPVIIERKLFQVPLNTTITM